jgi:hypothetical protein
MNITAKGRSALIVAAGVWMCFAGQMRATESDARTTDSTAKVDSAATATPVKPAVHHRTKKQAAAIATRKKDKTQSKSAPDTKVDEANAAAGTDAVATLPASVANANAQLPAGAPTDTTNVSAQAGNVLKTMGGQPTDAPAQQSSDASLQMVSADQLNELDRAIGDDKPPAPVLAAVTIDQPVVTRDNTAWDQTSFIGKIFIAFGGLLTMASAARMFMA